VSDDSLFFVAFCVLTFFFLPSLAYCEVYIMAALVALQIIPRARLVDTTIEDISYDHDLIVLQTKKGSISVKIQID
jgi:hypothetical protein